jgi:cell fate (sporulation/competence/biofilm development) regulator YlbF (YheA/YmcA/DUF963 family)
MNGQSTLPARVLTAADKLGESLASAEPVAALTESRARLDADADARALLDRMAAIDADLRRRQAEGTLTRADIDRARDAHVEASGNPSIRALVDAQQDASAYLPEVNAVISELLGWDFAAMAAVPGNC